MPALRTISQDGRVYSHKALLRDITVAVFKQSYVDTGRLAHKPAGDALFTTQFVPVTLQ